MGKLYLIMGKSATGKDHIYKDVVARSPYPLKTIIPYTTRPKRACETEGVEYHFVTENTLARMQAEGKVLECRKYDTVAGPWYYFTADDGQICLQSQSSILIVTPEAYAGLQKSLGAKQIVPIYIETPDKERLERAMKREAKQEQPNYVELCRRFLADTADFSEEVLKKLHIDRRFVNMDYETCVAEVLAAIAACEERMPQSEEADETVS